MFLSRHQIINLGLLFTVLMIISPKVWSASPLVSCNINIPSLDVNVTSQELTESQYLLRLPKGEYKVQIQCDNIDTGILSFNPVSVTSSQLIINQQIVERLDTSFISYLIPSVDFNGVLHLTLNGEKKLMLNWHSPSEFMGSHQRRILSISLFFGLGLTLAMYVLVVGNKINDKHFYLYSAYMVSVTLYFALQEAVLNLYFPLDSWSNTLYIHTLFSGLTVFFASRFIMHLLDLHVYWPRLSRYVILLGSNTVLFFALLAFILPSSAESTLNMIMGWLTLTIITVIFVMVGIAAKNRVHTANIVFIAMSLLFLAMSMRIALPSIDFDLRRYSLLVSIAIESFLFAWATAERIKYINQKRQVAEKQAFTDDLCAVLNRRGWLQAAHEKLLQHQEKGGFLMVAYIDINKFKPINDTYGHQVGDEVLKAVAKVLVNNVRSNGVVGRIGGDEFVVVNHFSHQDNIESEKRRIEERLKCSSIYTSIGKLNIDTSIGVKCYALPPPSVEHVLHEADQLMYQQKRQANK